MSPILNTASAPVALQAPRGHQSALDFRVDLLRVLPTAAGRGDPLAVRDGAQDEQGEDGDRDETDPYRHAHHEFGAVAVCLVGRPRQERALEDDAEGNHCLEGVRGARAVGHDGHDAEKVDGRDQHDEVQPRHRPRRDD
eukprot:CAMPEP_0175717290 /NCGR_PEP_ID=MMETSP0097-20121207/43583_1 /TAXON_ID=311494 /ORGANISM="Alexandrium monilatum, Strain CCMP3105" /LENGTH=138 /DNA_ID=CAMNT_0017024859 /DNA_START=63 /DNA_END=477 /DNA_ORIENTATION=+